MQDSAGVSVLHKYNCFAQRFRRVFVVLCKAWLAPGYMISPTAQLSMAGVVQASFDAAREEEIRARKAAALQHFDDFVAEK